MSKINKNQQLGPEGETLMSFAAAKGYRAAYETEGLGCHTLPIIGFAVMAGPLGCQLVPMVMHADGVIEQFDNQHGAVDVRIEGPDLPSFEDEIYQRRVQAEARFERSRK